MATVAEAIAVAVQHHQAGQLAEAERVYRQILDVDPNNAAVLRLLGVVATQVGNQDEAIQFLQRATQIQPDVAEAHYSLSVALKEQGRLDEAVASCRRALEIKPDFAEGHNNLGNALNEQGKFDEAVLSYRRALQVNPHYAAAHYNLGVALREQGKLDEAVANYRRALQIRPDFAEAHNNLGNALIEQGKLDEAVASCRRALQIKSDHPEAHYNLGNALNEQGKLDEAVDCYRRALQIKPVYAEAHYNLGVALNEQGKLDEAAACYQRAVQAKSDYAAAISGLTHHLQRLCRWEGLEHLTRLVVDEVDSTVTGETAEAISPFSFFTLHMPTTSEQQLRCARKWAPRRQNGAAREAHRSETTGARDDASIVTLGYLSADFHAHATAELVAELFEKHNRDRFRVFGYSYGRDDGSPLRRRLVDAFDRFADIRNTSFAQAADRITADGVDILIDLKGYTKDSRPRILAFRPAPIQVNYLGYPGTMGAEFMDYILVDDFIVPSAQQPFYSEKLVHLPGCYQVNDSNREISPQTPSRSDCHLPEEGFVFCCFNNNYKITPAVFDVWMRLLKAVPKSVLWLLESNRWAPPNLRREAEARGVSAERLVFAPRRPLPSHLARHRVADLFLDTFPVNAHTTASDSLWAGCPLVTMAGETFAFRVAGSLLRAVGLPELVTETLEEYEQLALRLARNRDELSALRARLAGSRDTCALFSGERFARNVEQAYQRMWEIHISGQPPQAFRVESRRTNCP